jgi:serine/threonine protein kinase
MLISDDPCGKQVSYVSLVFYLFFQLQMKKYCNYRALTREGGGTYGDVFSATNTKGETVIIKKIKTGSGGVKYPIELDVVTRFNHPNIMHVMEVLDNCDNNQTIGIVMKKALGTMYDVRSLDENGMIKVAFQLAKALQVLHENHVLHLDIKPGNILIFHSLDNPVVTVTDFGLSMYNYGHPNDTFGHGTAQYRAPELSEYNNPDGVYTFSPPNDIWSLGITLAEHFFRDFNPQFGLDFDRLEATAPRLTPLIRRMLQVTPSRRPTARQILEDPLFTGLVPYSGFLTEFPRVVAPVGRTPMALRQRLLRYNVTPEAYIIAVEMYHRLSSLYQTISGDPIEGEEVLDTVIFIAIKLCGKYHRDFNFLTSLVILRRLEKLIYRGLGYILHDSRLLDSITNESQLPEVSKILKEYPRLEGFVALRPGDGRGFRNTPSETNLLRVPSTR